MQIGRRGFLKGSGAAAAMAVLAPSLLPERAEAAGRSGSGPDVAIKVDVTKCIGCWWCYAACKHNRTHAETARPDWEGPPEIGPHTWTTLFTALRDGDEWDWRRHACMHCANASCENVCPTGAISHQGTAVVIDQEWCIGCGYCVHACPYDIPHKDEHLGTTRKCDMCIDRTRNGEIPFCVDACPTGALEFGERNEMLSLARERVELLKSTGHPRAFLYGEHELGGLGVFSVLDEPPPDYGLPEDPKEATASAWAKWLSGAATAGLIAAVPFWFLFKRASKHSE